MSSTASILPVPAVNAAIISRDRKILLTRRSPSVREPGKWCLPGGHLEYGEWWVPAMRREVAEETGLVVRAEKLIGIYSDPGLTIGQPASGATRRQFVATLFLVTDFEGDVKPNDEVDLWDWFPEGRLPSPMLKSHPIRVEDAFAFQRKVFVR